jgi:PAS domain S-box-containing protein
MTPSIASSSASSQARILVVEDEAIVAWDIEQNLVDLGFEVIALASSGDEALTQAASARPDLVLMDIRIQGDLDGIQAGEIIRHRYGVPLIYLTAHGDPETIDRAKRTEPEGYLLKPFKKAELRSVVELALYRHQMERRLREREHLVSTTLRSIADAVITTDQDGRITYMNPAAETLSGWRGDAAGGLGFHEVLRLRAPAARQAAADEDPVRTALRLRQPTPAEEGMAVARDGSERSVVYRAAPLTDDQKIYGAVLVARDVSAERRLQRQLEFADRLTSLGTLAAGVAHEINNPLAAITIDIDFALQKLRAAGTALPRELDVVIEALDEARSGADRVKKIVADLKTFARTGTDRPRDVDVRRVLETALHVVDNELRHRARVVTELGPPVPLVEAEDTRLGQVFVNLLVNAAQAIAPGAAERNEVRVRARADDRGRVVVEISDTGTGMTAEVQKRVFEPFFTTKPVGEGSGLGLSICHGIIKSMRGDIEVESTPGRGSTFRVILPPAGAARARLASVPPPPTAPAAARPRRGRVLAIDDDALVLKSITRAIEDEHDVVTVTSAREALAKIDAGERFDVILCDLMMPETTGTQLYQEVTRTHPELASRVVFLTGGAFTGEVLRFLESTAVPQIDKPFEPADLKRLVEAQVEAGRGG